MLTDVIIAHRNDYQTTVNCINALWVDPAKKVPPSMPYTEFRNNYRKMNQAQRQHG